MNFTRRHLTHWVPECVDIFVTWRLAGSPPHGREQPDDVQCGPLWLQDPRLASMVANALLHGDVARQFYELHAWVIMPNHVHVIFQPLAAMPKIMRWLKGRTGLRANKLLGRSGTPFWQDESFDHWIRNAQERHELIEYVENNPVKAGLVATKEQWQWSSAGWMAGEECITNNPQA